MPSEFGLSEDKIELRNEQVDICDSQILFLSARNEDFVEIVQDAGGSVLPSLRVVGIRRDDQVVLDVDIATECFGQSIPQQLHYFVVDLAHWQE